MKNVLKIKQLLLPLSIAVALSNCSSDSIPVEENTSVDTDSVSSSNSDIELDYGDAYWATLAQDYERFDVDAALEYRRSIKLTPEDYSIEGRWGPLIDWPEIATGAANLPDGRIVTWASTSVDDFGGKTAFTHGSTYDPATGLFTSSDNLVHNNFCAGVSMLPDGRPFAAGGGATIKTTTVFDSATNTWSKTDDLLTNRWYPTSTTLPTGQVHTALGTKDHPFTEIWTENNGWSLQTNISLQSVLNETAIPKANQRDWYPALNVAPNGSLFHAGPMPELFSVNLDEINAFDSHGDRENGNPHRLYNTTVFYDVGKMLLAGGGQPALSSAMTIDLNGSAPFVAPTSSMSFARSMQNSVVLPHGEVLVIGGNSSGKQFSDEGTQLIPEVWNPDTGQWTDQAPLAAPRNYHSTALLLKDGRVAAMGGGLCGDCGVNYQSGQIFEPPYLFNADGTEASRPNIDGSDIIANAGDTISINGSPDIVEFNMVRLVALTHHHTTDQRRVPLNFQSTGNGSYQLDIPSNTNVVIPGYYWIFAMDSQGVPSIGRTLKVNVTDTNLITAPDVPDTVTYEYYEGVWNNLPDFDQLTPVATGALGGFLLTPAQQDDHFGFRYTARINVDQAGAYTFYTASDDGSALFINGQQVVDNDGLHGVKEQQGTIQLTAGQHDIVVTYFEKTIGNVLNVSWQGPGFAKQNIASGLIELADQVSLLPDPEGEPLTYDPNEPAVDPVEPVVVPTGGQSNGIVSYEYFEGVWNNLPNFDQLTPVETGALESFSLAPAQQGDHFAFRYNAKITVPQTGAYTFYTASDDGSAVFINGTQVVDNDGLHGVKEKQGSIQLTAGQHDIVVTYFEKTGGNVLNVSWQGPGFSKQSINSGLTASVIQNPVEPTVEPVEPLVVPTGGQTDSLVSYEYFEGVWNNLPNFNQLTPVATGTLDNFSLSPAQQDDFFGFRFNAKINVTQAGTYTFFTASDDGSSLFINNTQVVNNDGLHANKEKQGTIQLTAGEHDIVVTYFEKTGGNTLSVNWQGPGFSKQSINSGLTGSTAINPVDPIVPVSVTQLTLGSAVQSSTAHGGVASRAIDGNTNGSYNNQSVTHTAPNNFQPWWQASLEGVSVVSEIKLWNRTNNCCSSRLSDFYVFLSDTPFASTDVDVTSNDPNVWSFFHSGAVGNSVSIPVNATGKYIRIQKTDSNPLSLAEVVVSGQPAGS